MTPLSPAPRALILGAGIQGLCVALAVSRAGWRVEIVDRAAAPMLRTSLRGEGKLHLGYVYGHERGRATAGLMVEGALAFAEYLDGWTAGAIPWEALRSEPFTYAILADSMVTPEALAEHYAWVDDLVAARLADGASYAGRRRVARATPMGAVRDGGFAGDVIAAFRTDEVAIDPALLRQYLIDAVAARDAVFHPQQTIHAVERTPHGFAVACSDAAGLGRVHHADAVVNCLWEGRLAIDATLGIAAPRPCLHRLRYAALGTLPSHAAQGVTTTFALGPFGDVVARADGRVYLSWYPAGLAGLAQGVMPPAAWEPLLDDPASTPHWRDLAAATQAALAERLPAVRSARIDAVTAGIVVAWGERDIDHPESELHRRHAIGVHAHDGYLSVDTGKLTTAPLFAAEVARVLGRAGAPRRG